MIELPTYPDEPLYVVEVTLDGVTFRLRFDYNQKADRWYFSIFDAGGVALRRGLKVLPYLDLLRLCRHVVGLPAAEIVALDAAGLAAAAPGLHELGRRVGLWYTGET